LAKSNLRQIGVFYCWYIEELRDSAQRNHLKRRVLIADIRAATQYPQKDFDKYIKQVERNYRQSLPQKEPPKPVAPETIEAKFRIKVRNKKGKPKGEGTNG